MKLGYARCSALDQNLDWQIDALTKEECDRFFQEKFTGIRKDLLRHVREEEWAEGLARIRR